MFETLLDVKNLFVKYKTDLETVYAVNGISFSLDKGDTMGIVGETGAGKTTTALTILKLLPERTGIIENGSIEFEGENLITASENEMMSKRGKKISMVFQDPMTSLNPVHTIGDQIAEVLNLHKNNHQSKKDIDKRVDELLEMVGISASRKGDYPHQFSGGMRQRTVIAIAIACEPDLLIADEPTTALDVTIQAQVLKLMKNLRSKFQTAMILITHDFGVVAQMCDKIAVMYAGEFVETGTLEDIFIGCCHHPYTEGLFGSIPMLEDENKSLLKPIKGSILDPTKRYEGCPFAPRCPYVFKGCEKKQKDVKISETHFIKCHRKKDNQI